MSLFQSKARQFVAVGAIIAGIPMVDRLPPEFYKLPPGRKVTVNGDTGEVCLDGETG